MTVGELGQRMTSAEFGEWMEYAVLEPFGPLRDDLRAGVVASVIANPYRDVKKRRQPFTSEDFFPTADFTPARQESIGEKVERWAAEHNALIAAQVATKRPH